MSRRQVDGHVARKRFGQNFLHDTNVIARIVRAVSPQPGDALVEIGPGMGALTGPLLDACGDMDVVELDRDLIPRLAESLGARGTLRIHAADALRFDFAALAAERGKPLRVVGNLPYNISTPLIFHLLDAAAHVRDMHFMLQKEVVERMAAAPGSGDYGKLSVLLQYRCRVESLFIVPPGCFTPRPKVDSAIVRLVPWEAPPVSVRREALLVQVVTAAFAQRRKTLRNTLREVLPVEAMASCGVDPGARAETLALEDFARLADALADLQEDSPR
jgi:16S rRNA (adenine1518-N6/adenine1519-N6)-dimethyltransferase